MEKYKHENMIDFVEGYNGSILIVSTTETHFTNADKFNGIEISFFGLTDSVYSDYTATLSITEALEIPLVITRLMETAKKWEHQTVSGAMELHFRITDDVKLSIIYANRSIGAGISGGNTICFFSSKQLPAVKKIVEKAITSILENK